MDPELLARAGGGACWRLVSDLSAINKDLRTVLARVRARIDSADTLRDAKTDAALGLMLSRNGEQPEYICFYD